jgi:hypothetical protein
MALADLARGYSQDYISTLDPLLEKYDISKEIYRSYGDQRYNSYMAIKELGLQEPIAQIQGHHFEEERKLQTLTVESNASGAAGADVVVPLTAAMFTNGKTYARKWFNVNFPDYAQATITDIDTVNETITLTPKSSTYAISVTAGDELVIGDSNFGEGTTQPEGIIRGFVIRNFYTQILKEAYRASGTAMTDEASVDVKRLADYIKNTPELGNTLVAMCQADVDFRMTVQLSNQMLWGTENDNASALSDPDTAAMDGSIWATKGLNAVTDALGQTYPYTVGTLSLTDFYAITDLLDQQLVSPLKPIWWLCGRKQKNEFDQLLMANNAIQYQTSYTKDMVRADIFGKESKEVFIDFSGLQLGGYSFACNVDYTFTDPKGMGAAGYNTPNLGFMIPLAEGKDPKTGKPVDSIKARYKKLGTYNRMFETWTRDWNQTNYDIREWELRCNLGYQFFGANRFVKLEGQ